MLYRFLQIYVGAILKLFFKDVKVSGLENIPKDKPVILAAFHPNSFLDAMVLDCLIRKPVWSLARGDAFKKPWVRNLLHKLCMMPIYRISEGKENLSKNDETFEQCAKVFRKGGQVLIFSEGLCTNQTQLLPLKKGTARLTLQAWEDGLDVHVVPTAVNYSQYTSIGKKVAINFGEPIQKSRFDNTEPTGINVNKFNSHLKTGLESVITRDFGFTSCRTPLHYLLYFPHFPLSIVLKYFVKNKTKGTVFFDSVYVGLFVATIPIYWATILSILFLCVL